MCMDVLLLLVTSNVVCGVPSADNVTTRMVVVAGRKDMQNDNEFMDGKHIFRASSFLYRPATRIMRTYMVDMYSATAMQKCRLQETPQMQPLMDF